MNSQLRTSDKKQISIALLLSAVTTLLLSLTILKPQFLLHPPTAKITIQDTATKNPKSWGTDVRIKSVKINGQVVPFEELGFDEGWVFLDNLLVAINPQQPVSISVPAENAEVLEIELQKHKGSGIVRISDGDQTLGELDLYSPDWEEITFRKQLGTISYTEHWLLLLTIFVLISGSVFLLPQVISITLQHKPASKFVKMIALCYGVLFIGGIYFGQIKAVISLAILFIAATIIFIKIYDFFQKDGKGVWLMNALLLSLSAAVLYYIVERINGNHENLSINYIVGNITIYLAILLLFFIVIRRMTSSVIFGSAVVYLFAIANYYVTLFRGSPIVPGDFYTIGTAASVAQNYHYTINWDLFSGTLILVTWFVIVRFATRGVKIASLKQILVSVLSFAIMCFLICSTEFYKPILDFWNLNSNVEKYGVAMSLVSNVRRMRIEPPEGYSNEYIESLYKKYVDQEHKTEEFKPNVIAIMNESFSDLSVLLDTIDSNLYMPYYNSMRENTVKGLAMASTIGGGTGNTEYEFLTGNSMAFLPGTVPYQQFVIKDSFSMVRYFKDLGYGTVAIHPYDKKGYNRQRVYPFLGFDSFLDIDAFIDPQLSRQRYVTDTESYKKVIEEFEKIKKSRQPAFIFNVTIQNHSDYTTGFYGEDRIKIPGREGEFLDVEEYLTLIKESDDAFEVLIDYFSTVEEPTAIVMFGDHQPQIESFFYEEMLGKPLEDWSLEETQKRYMVPFFIWTNYDIEEQSDMLTSVNYLSSILFDRAGIAMMPYQQFLLSLQETVPAMNLNGYMGADGRWHGYWEEDASYASLLDEYESIQYYNIFKKDKIKKGLSK